jgi:hypothetical protein
VNQALFLIVEVLCIVTIAVGVTLWFELGVGLVVAGGLGLVLAVAAQLPAGATGDV